MAAALMFWNFFLLVLLISHGFLAKSQASKAKTTIVISLDGVGWQYVGNNKTDTPNFDSIARNGVKAKNMMTVNPTSTIPTHMTFVTGLYPESHGLVSNNFYDPVLDADYNLETDCSFFDPMFYQESEPIWLTMEKLGIKTGAYFWPASTSYEQRPSYYEEHVCKINCSDYTPKTLKELRSRIGTKHCKFDGIANPYWKRIERTISWMKSDSPPRLVLLYFDYADGIGHNSGPYSKKYLNSIEMLDRHVIGYLVNKLQDANMLTSTNIIVVSDHSMVETSSERQVNFFEAVKYWWYSIKSPGIWPRGISADELFRRLNRLNNSHIKFYKKKDIPDELHWKNNARIPPIYFKLDTGWLQRTYNHGDYYWRGGSHGWAPNEDLAAIFYARGPSFKEGYNYNGSLRAVDLYPLLCHLVGIEPLANNGSLDNMMHLLKPTDDNAPTDSYSREMSQIKFKVDNKTRPNTASNKTHDGGYDNGENLNRTKPNEKSQLAMKRNQTKNDEMVNGQTEYLKTLITPRLVDGWNETYNEKMDTPTALQNKTSSLKARSATAVSTHNDEPVANSATRNKCYSSEIIKLTSLLVILIVIIWE